MENATLPVNQNLLTDSEGASAWHLARNAVLSGSEYVNRSDPRVVVWDTALRKIISGFLAAAQLKFSDLVRIDLREVCRQSVAAVYGEQAALDMVTVPAAHHSLLHCDDAETLSALRKRQLQHTLAKKGRPARTTTRFGTNVTWEVRIGSVVIPVSVVLLDTGSDLDHIQVTTLEAAWKAATTAELPKETIAVLNITGARSTISRLTERSEITLMPGTPQRMTVYSRLGLMQGSELPTLIIGAPTASRMHMNVNLGLWHVEYTNMPWLANPPRYTLQLQGSQSRRQQSTVSALPKSFIPVRYQGLLAVDCADESLPMDCRGLRRRVIARLGGETPQLIRPQAMDPYMPQLLLMAGDVESNPGPVGLDTDSDEEGTDVVSHENMNARCSYNRFARPNPSVIRLRKRPGGVTGYSYHRNGYSYTRSDSLPGTREHGTREEFADNINQAQMEIDDLCIQGLNGDPLTANWVTPGDWSINADGTLSADCNVVDLREIHGGKECRELVPIAHFHEWKINRILVREPPMMNTPSSNHEQIVMNIMLGIRLGPECYRPGLRHCTHISASDLPSLLPAPQIVRYGPVLYPHEKTAGAHEADGNLAEDPRFHFMDSRQQVLLWALRPPDPRPRPAYCHMVTCDCSGDLDGRGRADGIEYSTDSYDKGK